MISYYFKLNDKIETLNDKIISEIIQLKIQKMESNFLFMNQKCVVLIISSIISLLLHTINLEGIKKVIDSNAPDNFYGVFHRHLLYSNEVDISLFDINSFGANFWIFISVILLFLPISLTVNKKALYIIVFVFSILLSVNTDITVLKGVFGFEHFHTFVIIVGFFAFFANIQEFFKIKSIKKKKNYKNYEGFNNIDINDSENTFLKNEYYQLKKEQELFIQEIKESKKGMKELIKIKFDKKYQKDFFKENHATLSEIEQLINEIKKDKFVTEEDELKALFKINKKEITNT